MQTCSRTPELAKCFCRYAQRTRVVQLLGTWMELRRTRLRSWPVSVRSSRGQVLAPNLHSLSPMVTPLSHGHSHERLFFFPSLSIFFQKKMEERRDKARRDVGAIVLHVAYRASLLFPPPACFHLRSCRELQSPFCADLYSLDMYLEECGNTVDKASEPLPSLNSTCPHHAAVRLLLSLLAPFLAVILRLFG